MNRKLEDRIGAGCLKVFLGVISLSVLLILLGSCKTVKQSTSEKESVSDSVRTEIIEKIVKVPVTVYVEVPVEKKEKFSPDSTSHLETSFAVSDAKMIWIDGVAFLRHTLENIPQKIEKKDSVPVIYKYLTQWKTRRVSYTKTVIRERQLQWWQKGLMWIGFITIIIIFIVGLWLLVNKKLRR